MNTAFTRLVISTGILMAGILIGMFAKGFIGLIIAVAGIVGFIWTGGVQAYRDTFFNRF